MQVVESDKADMDVESFAEGILGACCSMRCSAAAENMHVHSGPQALAGALRCCLAGHSRSHSSSNSTLLPCHAATLAACPSAALQVPSLAHLPCPLSALLLCCRRDRGA